MPSAILERVKSVRADQPRGKSLRVVPIMGLSQSEPPYQLLAGAPAGAVEITEISSGGHVPVLSVQNKLDTRLFLVDGQELVGAKQNRILNTDVLVPAQRSIQIPVSCVEQGRWRYLSRSFSVGKSASHRIRSSKMARVHASLKRAGKHDADQAKVWDDVQCELAGAGCASPTAALNDAYQARDAELARIRQELTVPGEAVGLAVFHGSKLRGIDVFDRASTLQSFYATLLDSYAMDWLGTRPDVQERPAAEDLAAIDAVLSQAASAQWEGFASPGEGTDYRLGEKGLAGSALVWEERVVVHLQLFPQS